MSGVLTVTGQTRLTAKNSKVSERLAAIKAKYAPQAELSYALAA
jgi:hypothetical protein